MPTADEIALFHEPDPDENPWVVAPPADEIVENNPSWPDRHVWFADSIRAALGDRVVGLEHVGSTAVLGLAAKGVIDIDLTVADRWTLPGSRPAPSGVV